MGPLDLRGLPDHALVLIDSAPIIYFMEQHSVFSPLFKPVFQAHAAGQIRLAMTTITLTEVLTGPLHSGNEALAERYRAALLSWNVVDLDAEIAASAARLRASLRLKLADSIQAASAIAIGADALVTHDRDFSRLRALRVIS